MATRKVKERHVALYFYGIVLEQNIAGNIAKIF
jgi:hypothetical protein